MTVNHAHGDVLARKNGEGTIARVESERLHGGQFLWEFGRRRGKLPREAAERRPIEACGSVTTVPEGISRHDEAAAHTRKTAGKLAHARQIEEFLGHENRLKRLLVDARQGEVGTE